MGLPWYKRNPEKALNGMLELTLEEKGAYNTVLDLIYLKSGKLADDEKFIVRWLGRTNVRAWRRIKRSLISKNKLAIVDGFIRNRTADIVMGKPGINESLANVSDMFGESFPNHIGNLKANSAKNNGLRALEERRKKREEREEGTPNGVLFESFDEFWKMYPRKDAKKKARTVWEKAIKKTAPETIIAGLRKLLPDYEQRPKDKILLPTTFLEGERWNDERSDRQRSNGSGPHEAAPADSIAAGARAGARFAARHGLVDDRRKSDQRGVDDALEQDGFPPKIVDGS